MTPQELAAEGQRMLAAEREASRQKAIEDEARRTIGNRVCDAYAPPAGTEFTFERKRAWRREEPRVEHYRVVGVTFRGHYFSAFRWTVQQKLKSGEWGKPKEAQPEILPERLTKPLREAWGRAREGLEPDLPPSWE